MDSKSILVFFIIIYVARISAAISIAQINAARPTKVFNVNAYGAKPDGTTDNSNAFLRAWKDACEWELGRSILLIPRGGSYMINSAIFAGNCKRPISFMNRGVIKAPTDPKLFHSSNWIRFQYIDRLTIEGGGVFDGQGASAWKYNDCSTNSHCSTLPISLTLDFVTNSKIQGIKSINSKGVHMNLFSCKNINITNVQILAPGNSPNTDGIKFGGTNNVHISHSIISTGDDCVAILGGSGDIQIFNVTCGPGHGFSIGSLGQGIGDDSVYGVHVRNSTFTNAQNGLRIKTWAPSNPGIVSDFVCENIFMDRVENPIIIDQHYCPSGQCSNQAESNVQINNVVVRNIWGTSTKQVAVSMECSKHVPCKNVTLADINLGYRGPKGGGNSFASCSNVYGSSYGIQRPSGCIK